MLYYEKLEEVKDICMAYGFKYGEQISFHRWQREDEKIVRDFIEEEIEMYGDFEDE